MRTIALLSLIAVVGCSSGKPASLESLMPDESLNALRFGTDFELYSLDPINGDIESNSDGFQGVTVLGIIQPAQQDREKLIDALVVGVDENDGSLVTCFEPRHGIRVTYDNKQFDFVICFECHRINSYIDDKDSQTIFTSSTPAEVFNAVLLRASIPLPEPPDDGG